MTTAHEKPGSGMTLVLAICIGAIVLIGLAVVMGGMFFVSSSSSLSPTVVHSVHSGAWSSGGSSGSDAAGQYEMNQITDGQGNAWLFVRRDDAGRLVALVFGFGVEPFQRTPDGKSLTGQLDVLTDATVPLDGSKRVQVVENGEVREVETPMSLTHLEALTQTYGDDQIRVLYDAITSNAPAPVIGTPSHPAEPAEPASEEVDLVPVEPAAPNP